MYSIYSYVVVLLMLTEPGEPLECYKCAHVDSPNKCNTRASCSPSEICFTEVIGNGTDKFRLGCREHDQCFKRSTTSSFPGIVGRSSSSQSVCSRCCSVNGCNNALCAYETQLPSGNPTCEDNPDFDCRTISSAFDICRDINHAKLTCRRWCGLCDVDGGLAEWGSWGSCDVTCGNGHTSRSRTCTNPAPVNGGSDCSGPYSDVTSCTANKCPTNGQWSLWANWEACSASCGSGLQRRHRNCSNPFPSFDGHYCIGDNMNVRKCHSKPCPSNGIWTLWTTWNQCSVTCGIGLQHRHRNCSEPFQLSDGNHCIGDNMDVKICSMNPCSGWGSWTLWSKCSAICDAGMQTRTRICNSTDVSLQGFSCMGNDEESQLCTTIYCGDPKDCLDIKRLRPYSTDGVFTVKLPTSNQLMSVYCDMTTNGGGWTVFQHRMNGSVDFYKTFLEYENGFGNLKSEFWMGLSYIYEMTANHTNELRVDLTAANGTTSYETYQNFSLSPGPNYSLRIESGAGTAGNGMWYNNLQSFTTKDRDMDEASTNCAVDMHGGWWYSQCGWANLNGDYVTPGNLSAYNNGWGGVILYSFNEANSLESTKMMFRRK